MAKNRVSKSKGKKTAARGGRPPARKPVRGGKSARPAKPLQARPSAPHAHEQHAPVRPARRLPAAELAKFKDILCKIRDRVVDEIAFLAGDNLNRSQRDSSGDLSSYSFHMADQGTDNFDREFALNLVSSEQDALYEIDEALQRVEAGTFGTCESCGRAIEKARLLALPFTRMCVKCKTDSEKGRSRFRPFGPAVVQSAES